MGDIKPEDGEWWMLCHLNNGDMCVGCFVSGSFYQSQNHSEVPESAYSDDFVPLYRISRHHPINDVIDAHRNGAKVSRECDIFDGAFAQLTLDESLAKYKVEPEPRDLEIPWGVISPKYVQAEKQGVEVRLFTADNKHQTITADLLSIDLTGVPNGATAERPE